MAFFDKSCLKDHVDRKHLKITSSRKRLTCEKCEASFEFKNGLDGHMNSVHLNVRPYKCSSCPKDFTTAPGLNAC